MSIELPRDAEGHFCPFCGRKLEKVKVDAD